MRLERLEQTIFYKTQDTQNEKANQVHNRAAMTRLTS